MWPSEKNMILQKYFPIYISQQDIYKTSQELSRFNRSKRSSKLLNKQINYLLNKKELINYSTHYVTKINTGRNTAGVDGLIIKNNYQRKSLENSLFCMDLNNYQALPVKRVFIPKAGSDKMRGLGIPVIKDRVMQHVVKTCLEPMFEARFLQCNYGFRPSRGILDLARDVKMWLKKHKNKECFSQELDLKGCFDNIDHKSILAEISNKRCKKLINKWLKAGIVEKGVYYKTKKGVPQGGVISPLLSNIVLHKIDVWAMENLPNYCLENNKTTNHNQIMNCDQGPEPDHNLDFDSSHEAAYFRFADDIVILSTSTKLLSQIKTNIMPELLKIGLELNLEKCKTGSVTKGFDTLGLNFKSVNKQIRINPSKASILKLTKKIQDIWSINPITKKEKITQTNQIILGFAGYARFFNSSSSFKKIDFEVYKTIANSLKQDSILNTKEKNAPKPTNCNNSPKNQKNAHMNKCFGDKIVFKKHHIWLQNTFYHQKSDQFLIKARWIKLIKQSNNQNPDIQLKLSCPGIQPKPSCPPNYFLAFKDYPTYKTINKLNLKPINIFKDLRKNKIKKKPYKIQKN